MRYTEGTISITTGSYTVIGVGTDWKEVARAGQFISFANSGVWYHIGKVVSRTELTLSTPYGGGTLSGVSYEIVSDFTPKYGFPYPLRYDLDKASIIARSLEEIDALLQVFHDRVTDVEFPPTSVPDLTSTPDIQPIAIVISNQLVIDPLVSQPQIQTPTLEPVILVVSPASATSTPSIPNLSISALIRASNNTYTADTDQVRADGSATG